MQKTKILLTSILLTSSLSAISFDNGMSIDIEKDENNNLHPNIYLPLRWNNSLSSSIEYKTDETITENETVANTTDSDKDTTIEHTLARLNILNYDIQNKNTKYYFGFGLQYESFDKTQIGFAQSGSTNINFEHNINIEVQSIFLKSDFIYNANKLDTKLSLNIVPSSNLEVTQDTVLTDAVNSTGTGSSEEKLDLSYEIDLNLMTKTDSIVDFGLEANYRFLPLKYDLQLANSNNTYSTEKYDIEEKITTLTAKIYFNIKSFDDIMPSIGYITKKTDGINKLDDSTYSESENKLTFGFEKRF